MEYALGGLRALRARGADAFDLRSEVQAAYNAAVQRRLAGSVWNSGCGSWLPRLGRPQLDHVARSYRFVPRLPVELEAEPADARLVPA